ncbi:MAG TPA: hypothetical protein VGM08_02485 [Candidatus Saccharimonadales bacterium]|jgi:8-oxo-dGTP pyrophosphatase MutT (NUDIX family)
MGFFIGAGIVPEQDGTYVLIQEIRHEKAGYFNLSAGTAEVVRGIIREAAEAAGVTAEPQHFLG